MPKHAIQVHSVRKMLMYRISKLYYTENIGALDDASESDHFVAI